MPLNIIASVGNLNNSDAEQRKASSTVPYYLLLCCMFGAASNSYRWCFQSVWWLHMAIETLNRVVNLMTKGVHAAIVYVNTPGAVL